MQTTRSSEVDKSLYRKSDSDRGYHRGRAIYTARGPPYQPTMHFATTRKYNF